MPARLWDMISVCSTHLAAGAHRLRQREAFCKGQAGDVVPQTFQHSRCDSHQACMSSAQSQGLRRRTQQEALLGRAEHRGQSQGRHCAYRLTTGLLADQTPGDLHLNAAQHRPLFSVSCPATSGGSRHNVNPASNACSTVAMALIPCGTKMHQSCHLSATPTLAR